MVHCIDGNHLYHSFPVAIMQTCKQFIQSIKDHSEISEEAFFVADKVHQNLCRNLHDDMNIRCGNYLPFRSITNQCHIEMYAGVQ